MYGRATIIGWLGDAPRNVGKTADVAVFSVGFTTTKKGEDGKYKGAWIDCIAFGDYATSLLECKKGDLIFIEGNLQENHWTSQEGEECVKWQIAVSAYRLCKERGEVVQKAAPAVQKAKPQAKKEALKEVDIDNFEDDLAEMPF